jgi:hypothetical protein
MVMKQAVVAALAAVAAGIAAAGPAEAGARIELNFLPFGLGYDEYYGGPIFIPAPRYYYYEEPPPRMRPRYYAYEYEPEYYEPEVDPEYAPQPRIKKPVAKKASGISCDKATRIVSDYGFTQVKATSCKGKVYAFNALRDGKPFTIKVSAASGELTEVKKQ